MDDGFGELLRGAAGEQPGLAALRYAATGVAVLPCMPGAKRPLTAHGLRDASTDPVVIERWWSRWPTANVAVATGMAGVDVIDIDCRGEASGFTAMHEVERVGLGEGWVARVSTPSGGEHLYYPADPARPQRSWALPAVHVDFRGTGGYVLVPPSAITDRGSYRLVQTRPAGRLVDAAAIREMLRPPQLVSAPIGMPRRDLDRLRHLSGWVASRPEGTRNSGLFWAACRYAEAGINHADTHTQLGDAAGVAGLGQSEIGATIRSAYRTAPTAPPPFAARRAAPAPHREVSL